MATSPQSNSGQGNFSTSQSQQQGSLSPELVREIADKVYALLLSDLKIERERWRSLVNGGVAQTKGGR